MDDLVYIPFVHPTPPLLESWWWEPRGSSMPDEKTRERLLIEEERMLSEATK